MSANPPPVKPKMVKYRKKRSAGQSLERPGAGALVGSNLSNLTGEELGDGKLLAEEIRRHLEGAKAPRRKVRTVDVHPMLAESRDQPFSSPGWLFELKHDGYRLLAGKDGASAQLVFRRGRDASRLFPEIAAAVAKLPFRSFTLDGEVVALDWEGHASFQRLQKRSQLLRSVDIQRASLEYPATLFAFDLLAWEEFDLRPLPLAIRKSLLRQLLPMAGPLRFSDHVEERGKELFEQIRKRALEGIMAKKADSPYRAGRSPNWLKLCVGGGADFVVVGFPEPERSRIGFGALDLGLYRDGQLVYAGRVGTGFSDRQLSEIRTVLEPDRRASPACSGPIPAERGHVWVEPRLVCEVRFKQWTEEQLL